MSNNNIERMKKIIEDKKKAGSQQGFTDKTKPNKKIKNNSSAFKNTKRGGALDK